MIDCREVVNNAKSLQVSEQSLQPEQCQECLELEKEFAKNPGGKPMANKGLAFAAIAGGSAVLITAICAPFVTPAMRRMCLPFVPATTTQVNNVLKALGQAKPSQRLVDIGSGDGRIVVAAAKAGYLSHGIELNRWLVLYSRWSAWRSGVGHKATFSRQDLWKSNLSPYDKVVIFGVEEMMPELETKLGSELKEGATVAACRFPFPNWSPHQTVGEGIDSVWLYEKQ